MINIPPVPVKTEIHGPLIPDVTKAWKVGQVLNATVARDTVANDTVLIRMGQTVLEAKTPVTLRAGETIQLLVKALGDTPVLAVQAAATQPQMAAQNLRHFIAGQQDLAAMLALSRSAIADPLVSRQLKQQLVALTGNMPDLRQGLGASTLRQMVENSGVFLESRLNSAQTGSLSTDMKNQLLRIGARLEESAPGLLASAPRVAPDRLAAELGTLLKAEAGLLPLAVALTNRLSRAEQRGLQQALATGERGGLPRGMLEAFDALVRFIHRQADPDAVRERLSNLLETMALLRELKSATEGALAKITSQQLTPLTREQEHQLLLFDLHFKDGTEHQSVGFRLEQEPSAGSEAASGWTVTLGFEFEELGPVTARLHLSGNDIYTQFHAEKESTVARMAERIDLLETALGNIGFDQVRLGVARGSIQLPNDVADGVHLLDENA